MGEFWNACTRPVDRNGYGLSPQETDRLANFFEEKLRLLPDSLAVHEEWRRLSVTHGVSGVHASQKTKQDALSPQEVFTQVSPSIFVVESLDAAGTVIAKGSAVAVAPSEVVTNRHVTRGRCLLPPQAWRRRVTGLDQSY